MTTLKNRPKTALLVVDVQNGVVGGAHERDAVVANVQTAWGAPPPDQVIAHTNLYWTYETAPGRTAGTVETKDVDFGGTP
jgi:nicotinamidase-related amidase